MESIDRLTLELMTNRTHYKKYIASVDPIRHNEALDYLSNLEKYKTRILTATKAYLSDPDTSFNLEVNEIFIQFTKTMIRYFEMKDFEDSSDEDETLFPDKMNSPPVEDERIYHGEDRDEKSDEKMTNNMRSFWGKERVSKRL